MLLPKGVGKINRKTSGREGTVGGFVKSTADLIGSLQSNESKIPEILKLIDEILNYCESCSFNDSNDIFDYEVYLNIQVNSLFSKLEKYGLLTNGIFKDSALEDKIISLLRRLIIKGEHQIIYTTIEYYSEELYKKIFPIAVQFDQKYLLERGLL